MNGLLGEGELVVVQTALFLFSLIGWNFGRGDGCGDVACVEDEGGRRQATDQHVDGRRLGHLGARISRRRLPGVGGVKDAAGIRLEPANTVRFVAREDAEARACRRVVADHGLVTHQVPGVEREGEVHDDSVRA